MTPDVNVRSMQFVRVFPWLRIGRAVGCALSPTQLFLGLLAAVALRGLDKLLAPAAPTSIEQRYGLVIDASWGDAVMEFLQATPVLSPLSLDLRNVGTSSPWLLLQSAAAYTLWTIFGVSIARSAAVQFCRDESPSLQLASRWSLDRCASSLTSMLTPVGGVLCLGLTMALLALPGYVPGIGQLWLTVLAPVEVLLGIAAALILILLPILWPLSVAAVAIDDVDSFGGFSRAFSYLTSHIWSAAAMMILNLGAATIALAAIDLVMDGGWAATIRCVSWTIHTDSLESRVQPMGWCVPLLRTAVATSLFWTHVAIVYVFLRQLVDGTPVDTLAGYEDDKKFREPYPVVGMPAVRDSGTPGARPE